MKTIRVRVKDKHAAVLTRMACEVNTVWNFANETSQKAIRDRKVFLSGYELEKLTTGFSKCEGVTIMADTANKVCEEYATRRKQFKKARLAWRVSNPKSAKRSLGWIPFKKGNAKYRAGQIVYAGHKFSLWDSYGLGGYELRAGSFNADARGRWYFCAAVEVVLSKSAGTTALGIDLGLKVAATASDGQKVTGRLFRASEKKLATAQRAGHKRQARSIHAKIKNQRADAEPAGFLTTLAQPLVTCTSLQSNWRPENAATGLRKRTNESMSPGRCYRYLSRFGRLGPNSRSSPLHLQH